MTPRHPNGWKAWTPDEVDTLLRLASESTPMKVIAKHLGRTPGASAKKASELTKGYEAPPEPSA